MGGSKTSDRYKRKVCKKIRIGIRSVKIRSATYNQLEGREAFQRRYFRRSLQRTKSHIILLSYYGACGNNESYRKATRSQQRWVDDVAQVLWVHRTLPRNSQKETPFSLTYGSEAIISMSENDVAKDNREKIKEVDKRRGNKEIASIEEAYYRSKLRRYHNERISHSIHKIGDFVLLSQNNTGSTQVWQGPHLVSGVQGRELYKIVDASDHTLTQTAKSTSLHKFYM
ncbi:reverse transcriptase domain-containing protein [Tanacetum coccineum]